MDAVDDEVQAPAPPAVGLEVEHEAVQHVLAEGPRDGAERKHSDDRCNRQVLMSDRADEQVSDQRQVEERRYSGMYARTPLQDRVLEHARRHLLREVRLAL